MHKLFSAIALSFFSAIILTMPQFSYAANKSGGMPPAVAVGTVKLTTWQASITAIGTLSANQGIMVKPEINGRITAIYFHSGELVKAGTPLLQLNSAILQADYTEAGAKAKLSQENYRRAVALYSKRVFAKADLENAAANTQADQAAADQAKAMLAQTLILAPFSGRLGLRQVNLGDYVAAGQMLVNLEATDPLRVDFSIPEIYLDQLALGQTITFTTRSAVKQIFKGTIYALNSAIDPNTRMLGVRAVVANKAQTLIPGAFVNVKLLTGSARNMLVIPQTALSYEGNSICVYKVRDDKAIRTTVTTGERQGDDIVIITGLKAGDKIITAGQMKVTDGQAISIAPPLN